MNAPTGAQLVTLFVLALPIAAISWTITHEELFKEVHDFCVDRSQRSRAFIARKFFYMLTCEYCFSHYVSAVAVWMTGFTLLFDDWRGHTIAWLALVWIAIHYISLYGRLRLGIRSERLDIGLKEAVSERAGVAKMEERAKPHGRRAV